MHVASSTRSVDLSVLVGTSLSVNLSVGPPNFEPGGAKLRTLVPSLTSRLACLAAYLSFFLLRASLVTRHELCLPVLHSSPEFSPMQHEGTQFLFPTASIHGDLQCQQTLRPLLALTVRQGARHSGLQEAIETLRVRVVNGPAKPDSEAEWERRIVDVLE